MLGRGAESPTAEGPVHVLAAAVLELQLAGGIIALVPPPQALSALMRVTLCLARQPDLVPRTLPELQARLDAAVGVDLSGLLIGLERLPVCVNADGQITIEFAPRVRLDGTSAQPPGDAVTDVLAWAEHRPRPAEITDEAHYPYHWQPFVDLIAAVREGDAMASSALRDGLDNLSGTGWRKLADALADIAAGNPADLGDLGATERKVVDWIAERAAGAR